MARNDPVFNLRMPSELKDLVSERAKENGRSINAELVFLINRAMQLDSDIDALVAKYSSNDKLDEEKATELEILQEKMLAIQKEQNELLMKKVEVLSRMAGYKKPT
ncbi:Arc family DNA-binding protein [Atlantibacter hermannii]|uniref:Arc family DNA-binding protein n=1 Tax=Atlantibacter hermannii TaxID=565 RepID=UPI001C6FFEF4|nr:Arc family DNA-binding protein [Atlantibacter hermannii]MBW9430495.1 Arc family DNA-binding protein [Atlantibacter hermannii]